MHLRCLGHHTNDIDDDMREWDTSAAVMWAVRPDSAGPQEVEAALREEFRLRHGEVTVARHFPESFLIKFKHAHHCTEVLRKGSAKRHGVEVFFSKWRSLRDAHGVTLLFRVKLCLDRVPTHAWTAVIVERLISRSCALEGIKTDLEKPSEAKTIDLWAWTANPSAIPKCVWLTFSGRARDARLDTVLIRLDFGGPGAPSVRRLAPWRLGVLDGALEARSAENQVPRSSQFRGGQNGEGEDDQRRTKEDGRGRQRRRDDDDDKREGRGHDGHARRGRDLRDRRDNREVRRERTRSPRRRDWGSDNRHGGRRRANGATCTGFGDAALLPEHLPRLKDLRSTEVIELQSIFAHQASAIKEAAQRMVQGDHVTDRMRPVLELFNDYIAKAALLVEKLQLGDPQLSGTEAWSAPLRSGRAAGCNTIPAHHVFKRVLGCLPEDQTAGHLATTTFLEVDVALQELQLHETMGEGFIGPLPASPVQAVSPLDCRELQEALAGSFPASSGTQAPGIAFQCSPDSAASSPSDVNGEALLQALFTKPAEPVLSASCTPRASLGAPCRGVLLEGGRQAQQNSRRLVDGPPSPDKISPTPARRRRRRRVFDMSTGPLPQEMIAALTALFNLEDINAEDLDAALLEMAGEGVADLQDGVAQLQAEASQRAAAQEAAI
ncbi:hypothetical protein BS78_08G003400 [Paspalum vaginatum]|nr:hypothetical protein BS78_08G003400 [Paspalum vaginatum]